MNIDTSSDPRAQSEIVNSIAAELRDGKLAFFFGAGISYDAPACRPLWSELRTLLFASLQQRSGSSGSSKATAALQRLRPEIVLQVLYRELGIAALRPLDVFLGGTPNLMHVVAAKAMALGNHLCTTNFDNLIEIASVLCGVPFQLCACDETIAQYRGRYQVLKLHGTLVDADGKDQRSTIVATLEQVRDGLSKVKSEALRYWMADRTIVFLGYSGLDEFDIMPALRTVRPDRAIWVHHLDARTQTFVDPAMDNSIRSCFKECRLIRTHTGSLVEAIYIQAFSDVPQYMTLISDSMSKVSRYEALHTEGRLLEHAGEMDEAMVRYDEAKEIAESLRDNAKIFRALDDLAHIAGVQGRTRQALATYIAMANVAEGPSDRARALFGQGKAYRVLGRYQLAIDTLKQAQALFVEVGECDSAMSLLYDLGESYLITSALDIAESSFRTREQYFRGKGDLERETWSRLGRARVAMAREDIGTAWHLLTDIAMEFSDVLEEFTRAWLNVWLGDTERLRESFPDAEARYTQAEQGLSRVGDIAGICCVKLGKAEIARANGDYATARGYFVDVLASMRPVERELLVAHALLGLAETDRLEGAHKPDYRGALQKYETMGVLSGLIDTVVGQCLVDSSWMYPNGNTISQELNDLLRGSQLEERTRKRIEHLIRSAPRTLHPLCFV